MSELKRTQLYDVHVAAGAEMVDFGGWEMPIQYPSGIIAEHLYTRQVCSLFDRRAGSQEIPAARADQQRGGAGRESGAVLHHPQ